MQRDAMPEDLKKTCLGLYHGYQRRVQWYHAQRREILTQSAANFATYHDAGGEECREYGGRSGGLHRPSERKAEAMLALEEHPETLRMRAVEQAMHSVGADLDSEELRQRLRKAILLNCESGRTYPFELLNLTEFSRMDFYRRRNRFLFEIAKYLDFA